MIDPIGLQGRLMKLNYAAMRRGPHAAQLTFQLGRIHADNGVKRQGLEGGCDVGIVVDISVQ